MLGLLDRLCAVAKYEAKSSPSLTGFYPITMLADASGNVLCDETGTPIVVRAPVDVLAIGPDDRSVVFAHPNQLVKRSKAAEITSASTSTLKRAEANGQVRPIRVSERDVSYFMADLNGWIMRRLQKSS